MKHFVAFIKKICISLLCIAFCAFVFVTSTSCSDSDRIDIGFFPNITHAQALYSASKGVFENILEDNGKTGMYVFNAGPAEMESIRGGMLDIGYIGPVPAITGYCSSDENVRIIAGAAYGGSVLVTAAGQSIDSVLELTGKCIAVPQFGNTQDILLRMLLKNAGMEDAVEIIQQDNANIMALLTSGDIDGALVPEPWGSRLVNEAGAEILLDYDEMLGGDYPVAVVIVRADYLESNREDVKAFLKAHILATEEINQDIPAAANCINEMIQRLTGVALDGDVLRSAFDRIDINYGISYQSVESFVGMCLDQGLIDGNIDVDRLIDTSVLEEVLAEIGE